MKPRTSSLFYLLTPCVVLAGFAFYLSRIPRNKPKEDTTEGPFRVSMSETEIQPLDAFKGYDRGFKLVVDQHGPRPKWWGHHSFGLIGGIEDFKNWTFLLEKQGKRRPFHPSRGEFWVSAYDQDKRRYTNDFLLHCGDIPPDWSLKARGKITVSDGLTDLISPIPFEITLKKEGKEWQPPQLSTDTALEMKSIKIVKVNARSYKALITLSGPDVNKEKTSWSHSGILLDGNWRSFSYKGFRRLGQMLSPSKFLRVYQFDWDPVELSAAAPHDVIAVNEVSIDNRWPYTIAFYIKRNGKVPLGDVQPLTRPTQTETAHPS